MLGSLISFSHKYVNLNFQEFCPLSYFLALTTNPYRTCHWQSGNCRFRIALGCQLCQVDHNVSSQWLRPGLYKKAIQALCFSHGSPHNRPTIWLKYFMQIFNVIKISSCPHTRRLTDSHIWGNKNWCQCRLSFNTFLFVVLAAPLHTFWGVCVQVRCQWFSICRNSRSQLALSAGAGLSGPQFLLLLLRTAAAWNKCRVNASADVASDTTTSPIPATMNAAWTWPQLQRQHTHNTQIGLIDTNT